MTPSERLAKAREAAQALRDAGQKPVIMTPAEKAAADPKSLRKAITAFCWRCVGESRKDVTNCTATRCPLYPVRPWQKGDEE